MPSGAHNRAVRETIPEIIAHLESNEKSILFFDEIDKLYHETSWISYVRAELFDILDGAFPLGVKLDGADDSTDEEEDLRKVALTEKLRTKAFCLAAGTFQDFYDTQTSRSIGFHVDATSRADPDHEAIVQRMPRELANRFNSQLLFLPPLEPGHYELIAEEAEQSLPSWIRPAFRRAARLRMSQAIVARSGFRFIEEALADALRAVQGPAIGPTANQE